MCKCLLVYKCRRLWWWINVKIYTNITFPKSIIINYQTSNVVACVFLFGADALFLLKAAGADGLFCFEQRSVQMDILFLNSGQCRWTFLFWTAGSADGLFCLGTAGSTDGLFCFWTADSADGVFFLLTASGADGPRRKINKKLSIPYCGSLLLCYYTYYVQYSFLSLFSNSPQWIWKRMMIYPTRRPYRRTSTCSVATSYLKTSSNNSSVRKSCLWTIKNS